MHIFNAGHWWSGCIAGLALLFAADASARIEGEVGDTFDLTAKAGHIYAGDASSIYTWGFASGDGPMQYPGVTLIVDEGETVTVRLRNELPAWAGNVSLLFPGQHVEESGGAPGLLAAEAPPDGTTVVTYTFVASAPGTYLYHSGTRPELHVEMGLVGALIVRPASGASRAYNDPATAFDREYLFLLSEMDSRIHDRVEALGPRGRLDEVDLTTRDPVYWFINGRNAPDTMADSYSPWLPNQPYNALPRMHPGERVLTRIIGAGFDLHPFHQHGNHVRVIAKDGRLLSTGAGAGPDLSFEVFTVQSVPGETVDAIYEWTGAGLGWDIYGVGPGYEHDCVDGDADGFDDTTSEYCADHGKPFPVALPEQQNLTFGGWYSGSPYLGAPGTLPPGEGGLNPNAGFVHMWHTHTEKEMTNFDIFPGGMMTMLIIEPPGVPID